MGLCLILSQYNPIAFMFMAIVLIVLVIKFSFLLRLGIWKNDTIVPNEFDNWVLNNLFIY
jgi:hypothetical protein